MNSQRLTQPHLLVVDDDPIFRAMVSKEGLKRGINVTTCSSLREVTTMAVPRLFDFAIVDYYLDNLQENLRGTEVAAALESTPILLASSSDRSVEDEVAWPQSIRKFINKKVGVAAILDAAMTLRPNF